MTGQNGLYTYCGLLLVLFLCLQLTPGTYFVRFFGNINPTILFLVLSVFSFIAFNYLKRFNFLIKCRDIWKGIHIAPGLAVLFFLVVLMADIRWGFPSDINVPFPYSLSFYPVIGLMAEVLLHLLPVSLLLFFLNLLTGQRLSQELRIKIAIFSVALLEAYYQAHFSYLDDPSKMKLVVFVFFHLLTFNLVQFWLFRKFGFLVMYILRMIYYLFWHILWGIWRLDFLF